MWSFASLTSCRASLPWWSCDYLPNCKVFPWWSYDYLLHYLQSFPCWSCDHLPHSLQGFPLVKDGKVIVHLVEPTNRLESSEMFFQVIAIKSYCKLLIFVFVCWSRYFRQNIVSSQCPLLNSRTSSRKRTICCSCISFLFFSFLWWRFERNYTEI